MKNHGIFGHKCHIDINLDLDILYIKLKHLTCKQIGRVFNIVNNTTTDVTSRCINRYFAHVTRMRGYKLPLYCLSLLIADRF